MSVGKTEPPQVFMGNETQNISVRENIVKKK